MFGDLAAAILVSLQPASSSYHIHELEDVKTSYRLIPPPSPSGFCDGDPTNDLTLADGTTVGAGEDPDVFIDSWQVPNTTGYVSHGRHRELNCSTSDCSGCLLMLHNAAFRRCHAFVRTPVHGETRTTALVDSLLGSEINTVKIK